MEPADLLAEWLVLEGRLSDLRERAKQPPDGWLLLSGREREGIERRMADIVQRWDSPAAFHSALEAHRG